MDIAKVFEMLSQGKIISSNSLEYVEYTNMLFNDDFRNEVNETLNKIGYRLTAENGYFYMAKKGRLSPSEQQSFISAHKDIIIAIAFLIQLHPRIDRGSIISYVDTMASYSTIKINDPLIKDKLLYLSWIKNKEDDREMIEQLFKHLEKTKILERPDANNTDRYKVLDAFNYYINIIQILEKGEDLC